MSDFPLDEQYHHYKVAVYDNLFGGMVYGKGQETRHSAFNF
jgi:hypothetical protein